MTTVAAQGNSTANCKVRRWRLGLVLAATATLAGCYPEDELRQVVPSPDGRLLAVTSARLGLRVVSAEGRPEAWESAGLPRVVRSAPVAWSRDGVVLYASAETSGTVSVFRLPRTGEAARVWMGKARETHPAELANGHLLSWLGGGVVAAGNLLESDPQTTETAAHYLTDWGVAHPAVSPDGTRVAVTVYDAWTPRVRILDVATSGTAAEFRAPGPFPHDPGAVRWSADGSSLLVRAAASAAAFSRTSDGILTTAPRVRAWQWTEWRPGAQETSQVLRVPESASEVVRVAGGALVQLREGRLYRGEREGAPLGDAAFRLSGVVPLGTSQTAVAAVAEDELIALVRLDAPRGRRAFEILEPRLEDRLTLAEHYLAAGRRGRADQLFRSLYNALQYAADPLQTELAYLNNLRRVGRGGEAARMMERILRQRGAALGRRAAPVWRALGYCYLTDVRDLQRAAVAFARAAEADPDLAADDQALADWRALLELPDLTAARAAAAMLRARVEADAPGFVAAARRVIAAAPGNRPAQRLFLWNFEPPAAQIYLFPFALRVLPITESDAGTLTDEFIEACPEAEEVPMLCQNRLVQLLVREDAPSLRERIARLASRVTTAEMAGLIEAMGEEALYHGERRPHLVVTLATLLDDETAGLRPVVRRAGGRTERTAELVRLVASVQNAWPGSEGATTQSLVRTARRAAYVAQMTDMLSLGSDDAAPADWLLHVHLTRALAERLAGRPRQELRALDRALQVLARERVDSEALQFEVQYRRDLAAASAGLNPAVRGALAEILRLAGDELVRPSWESEAVVAALRVAEAQYRASYAAGDTTGAAVLAHEAALLLRRLGRDEDAQAALRWSLGGGQAGCEPVLYAPEFLVRKALWEGVLVCEMLEDRWSALGAVTMLRDVPGGGAFEKDWADFTEARLMLEMGLEREEARARLRALAARLGNRPLGIRAAQY